MKLSKFTAAALGAVALGGLTLTLTLDSNAQGGGAPPAQGPPGAGPRPGGGFQGGPPPPGAPGQQPGQFRQMPGNFGGGGGGGTAMESDNSFLYIVQGNMLFKVSKSDLRIMGQTPLMQMPQRGGDFPPGAPRPGGGGGGTPPPTANTK